MADLLDPDKPLCIQFPLSSAFNEKLTLETKRGLRGRFPFNQNFRNFRSETEWNGKNSGKSFRKFRNTF